MEQFEEDNFDEIDEQLDYIQLDQQKQKFEEICYKESDYCRPHLELIDQQKDDLYIMLIDIDYYVPQNEKRAVIRIYGVNQAGNSVLLHVQNFLSYFYVECPIQFSPTQKKLEELKELLQEKGKSIRTISNNSDSIEKIEIIKKESIRFFKGEGDSRINFLKISTNQPSFVSSYRTLFEKGISYENVNFSTKVYEANIAYILRFMVDNDMQGMQWLKLPADHYVIRKHQLMSRCQLELDIQYSSIIPLKPEDEWNKIAPLRILSFDIECSAKGFPQAERDPVIQIASICKVHSQDNHFLKTVYTLKSCSNIVDSEVRCFDNESDLLNAWMLLIQVLDPDILTGYNIVNFDLPYIMNRSKALKIKDFGYFGRILNKQSQIKDGKYQSKVMGLRDTKDINIEGRIQLDMLVHMHKEQKLSSYSLNNVSYHFLKEQKEDVHHGIISQLQNGTPDTRRRLAIYCLKDAYLPLRLLERLCCIYNYVEMARVTGVPLNFLCTKGQQIKVVSQLLRKLKERDMIIPSERNRNTEGKFEGAFVLEPKSGHYTTPVATLDFASLYPSIMRAHNLCHTTLIPRGQEKNLREDQYVKSPQGYCFVNSQTRKGVLPEILEDLMTARKKAKKEMAQTTDQFLKQVLDGRQLAYKISANSIYGFTGAQNGQLPCLEISSSVTAFGREMIYYTKNKVMEVYSKKNGYSFDADVIYGDTDSVMVNLNVNSVSEAMEIGKQAAEIVSRGFKDPIKLEFEKVYYPYLLYSKKRYAGLFWTNPEKWDKLDKKGIESVRRDNCGLIRIMIDECLKMILIDNNVLKAVNYVKKMVSDLLINKIDLSLLVITKALTKKSQEDDDEEEDEEGKKKQKQENNNIYKGKQAHVELAEKIKKRDPNGNGPQIGDRIPYVMIAGAKGSRNYENAEDPLYALEKELPIDNNYYIENQLKKPLKRLFEIVIGNVDSLFYGEHTKKQYIPKLSTKSGSLGKFLIKKLQCLSCKIEISQGALCVNCEGKALDIYLEKQLELNELQKDFAELWTQCQRCQGSTHQDVLCSNSDCPIFYRRKKVQKDIQQKQEVFDSLDSSW